MSTSIIKQPGTRITGDKGGGNIVISYNVASDELWDFIPENGTKLPEDIPQFSDLLFSSYDITTLPAGRCQVNLTYTPAAQYENKNHDEGETETTLSSSLTEVDLSRHPNYKYKWNHYLLGMSDSANPTQPSLPAWFDTATTPEDENETYKWLKSKADAENYITANSKKDTETDTTYTWFLIGYRTQPEGQEAYLLPTVEITETTYWTNKTKAMKAAAKIGQKETPQEDYGKTGGEWLVMSVSQQKSGKYYVVTKTYQWAEKWNDDFYN